MGSEPWSCLRPAGVSGDPGTGHPTSAPWCRVRATRVLPSSGGGVLCWKLNAGRTSRASPYLPCHMRSLSLGDSGQWWQEAPGAGVGAHLPGLPAKRRLAVNVLFSCSLPLSSHLPQPASGLRASGHRGRGPGCREPSSPYGHCWNPDTWGAGARAPAPLWEGLSPSVPWGALQGTQLPPEEG